MNIYKKVNREVPLIETEVFLTVFRLAVLYRPNSLLIFLTLSIEIKIKLERLSKGLIFLR